MRLGWWTRCHRFEPIPNTTPVNNAGLHTKHKENAVLSSAQFPVTAYLSLALARFGCPINGPFNILYRAWHISSGQDEQSRLLTPSRTLCWSMHLSHNNIVLRLLPLAAIYLVHSRDHFGIRTPQSSGLSLKSDARGHHQTGQLWHVRVNDFLQNRTPWSLSKLGTAHKFIGCTYQIQR